MRVFVCMCRCALITTLFFCLHNKHQHVREYKDRSSNMFICLALYLFTYLPTFYKWEIANAAVWNYLQAFLWFFHCCGRLKETFSTLLRSHTACRFSYATLLSLSYFFISCDISIQAILLQFVLGFRIFFEVRVL